MACLALTMSAHVLWCRRANLRTRGHTRRGREIRIRSFFSSLKDGLAEVEVQLGPTLASTVVAEQAQGAYLGPGGIVYEASKTHLGCEKNWFVPPGPFEDHLHEPSAAARWRPMPPTYWATRVPARCAWARGLEAVSVSRGLWEGGLRRRGPCSEAVWCQIKT